MEKVIVKFSNKDWCFRIILIAVIGFSLHVQFVSAYMGR